MTTTPRVLAGCVVFLSILGGLKPAPPEFVSGVMAQPQQAPVRPVPPPPVPPPLIALRLSDYLSETEAGMRLGAFGKYARSAPLETRKEGVVGLNGAFELKSFSVYRSLKDLLESVRTGRIPDERARVEVFIRQWHVVTISHCTRWQLDCADTLFASAELYFGGTADVLVLASARAEARGAGAEAQSLLQRALAIDADHISAHLRLGRLLVAAGRTADAARELAHALDRARAESNAGAAYFALMSLADLDARAGRTTSARARRTEATALKAFDHPCFTDLQPDEIYRAGLFYEQPWRLAALRTLTR